MTRDLRDRGRISAEQGTATASSDTRLPAYAVPVDEEGITRARALAAGLKTRLHSSQQPAPVVEAAYLLSEARDQNCPLLERIRILGLLASVLDHYFVDRAPALSEEEQGEIAASLDPLLQESYVELRENLLPVLSVENGIEVRRPNDLTPEHRDYLRGFFRQQLYPMLTPLAVDPGHPFPFISSQSINLLVHLSSPDLGMGPLSYARIKVPRLMSRFVSIPSTAKKRLYIWSEDAVTSFLDELFPGMQIENVFLFRVLRASSGSRNGDEFEAQSRGLRHQQLSSPVVRLEVETSMPDSVVEWLSSKLRVPLQLCFRSDGPLALFQLVDLANLAHPLE